MNANEEILTERLNEALTNCIEKLGITEVKLLIDDFFSNLDDDEEDYDEIQIDDLIDDDNEENYDTVDEVDIEYYGDVDTEDIDDMENIDDEEFENLDEEDLDDELGSETDLQPKITSNIYEVNEFDDWD